MGQHRKFLTFFFIYLFMLKFSLLATALTLGLPTLAQIPQGEALTHQRAEKPMVMGRVCDTNGDAIADAVVLVKGTPRPIKTGKNGMFRLPGKPGDRLTLVVQALGYDTEEREVTLGSGEEQQSGLFFFLTEHHRNLPQVDVLGRRERSYKNTVSFIGTKTATALKDVPQSVGYVTKELMIDQGAFTVNDVVKNISGVNQYTFYNDFSIRGFRATGNRNSGNLVNGMRTQTSLWRQSSLANIERVEVIKGPASALFGNAAPGGIINRVTKKPLDTERRSVSATIGSFNTQKAYADFTGPLNGKHNLLYRLNLGYEDTDSYRDLQGLETFVIAPSFTYLPDDRTSFNVDLVYNANNGKVDRGQTIFGDAALTSRPISSSLSAANDYLKENTFNLTVALSHRFNEHLSFNSTYLFSSYNEDLMEHTQANAYAMNADGTEDPNRVLMRATQRQRHFRNNSFNNYFVYTAKMGEFSHQVMLGYDYFQTELMPGSSYIEAAGYLLKNGKSTNKFDKTKIGNYQLDADGNPKTNVPYFDLRTNSGNNYQDISKYVFASKSNNPYWQYTHGIYVQEQLSWWRLKLLLSGRMEYFTDVLNMGTTKEKKTTQHAFTPRIGLVYELTPMVNLYGTWIKGFEPQSAAIQSDPATGAPFDPVYSELWEAGAKAELLNKRLSVTLALFQIKQRNSLYDAGDVARPDLKLQIGEERSRGFELDVAGRILPYWSIVANYTYNAAKITQAPAGTKDLNLQRPNTPKHSGNMWTKFIIPRGEFRNLGFGLGMNFVTEREGQVAKRTNTVVYPGYALFNAALYYKVNEIQLQLNFNNVFNKTYWVGGYDRLRSFPGAPRNVNLSATFHF